MIHTVMKPFKTFSITGGHLLIFYSRLMLKTMSNVCGVTLNAY